MTFRFGEKEIERLCWKENEEEKEEEEDEEQPLFDERQRTPKNTPCAEGFATTGCMCERGFANWRIYFNAMCTKMEDLVDERTIRGRLKIDQKYRNHSAVNAHRHLKVALFCETTAFIISVDLSSSNRKYKYKTTLSLSLLRLTTTAALLAYASSSYSKSRTISRGISPFGGG